MSKPIPPKIILIDSNVLEKDKKKQIQRKNMNMKTKNSLCAKIFNRKREIEKRKSEKKK